MTKDNERDVEMDKNIIQVLVLRGMQASGKSTWAKKYVVENQNFKRISRDDFRHMLSSYTFNEENEKIVNRMVFSAIENLIETGYNLIVDQMNLSEKYLKKLKANIEMIAHTFEKKVEFIVKEFPITISEAIERDKHRPNSLGDKILKRTWRTHELALKKMLNANKPVYIERNDVPNCIICDIDGTLSDSHNRRIFDEESCTGDYVIKPVAKLLRMLKTNPLWNANGSQIIIFSGRKDSAKAETIKWLNSNLIPFDELHMRKHDDNRKDTLVKSDMFEAHIRNKYFCQFVIDDRHDVCQRWIDMGLFVFNVNQDPLAKSKF